jgi:hypothetical protein
MAKRDRTPFPRSRGRTQRAAARRRLRGRRLVKAASRRRARQRAIGTRHTTTPSADDTPPPAHDPLDIGRTPKWVRTRGLWRGLTRRRCARRARRATRTDRFGCLEVGRARRQTPSGNGILYEVRTASIEERHRVEVMKYIATVVLLVAVLVPSAFAAGQARDPRVPKMQSQIRQLQATVRGLVSRGPLTDLQVVSNNTDFDAFPAKGNAIRCPSGMRVIGGGGSVNGRDPDVAALTHSAPLNDESWSVSAYAFPRSGPLPAGSTMWSLRGYAVCVTPYVR